MYILALIPAFIAAYVILTWGLQYLFDVKNREPHYPLYHILLIVVTFAIVMLFVWQIDDMEWSNRFQHALGGGAMMILVTYCAFQAARIDVNRLQFFILAVCIATVFGVANELAESLLQNYTGIIFAPNINDTWLDLWSNTIGAVVVGGLVSFLIWKK